MSSQAYVGLPPKNGPLSSSIGSVATVTTVADREANDPEECGRVGGWVASFDKLLEDSLGVHTLLVSQSVMIIGGKGSSCNYSSLSIYRYQLLIVHPIK